MILRSLSCFLGSKTLIVFGMKFDVFLKSGKNGHHALKNNSYLSHLKGKVHSFLYEMFCSKSMPFFIFFSQMTLKIHNSH